MIILLVSVNIKNGTVVAINQDAAFLGTASCSGVFRKKSHT
jgi:hypothetical protein